MVVVHAKKKMVVFLVVSGGGGRFQGRATSLVVVERRFITLLALPTYYTVSKTLQALENSV